MNTACEYSLVYLVSVMKDQLFNSQLRNSLSTYVHTYVCTLVIVYICTSVHMHTSLSPTYLMYNVHVCTIPSM